MKLSPSEVQRFYDIWMPLLIFANDRLKVVPANLLPVGGSWDVPNVVQVRDAMWANDPVREAFIAENPANLSAEDLALVGSWRYRVDDTFTVLRHLKKHTLFIGKKVVYAVVGLNSPLSEVVPFVPSYIKAVLLPFGDRIIYDSLVNSYNITLGPGIRRSLEDTYRDAVERGAVLHSLLPQSVSATDGLDKLRTTNTKVLDAFRTHLFKSGLSQKVVDRDMASVTAFAEGLLALPEPQSLREFDFDLIANHVTQMDAATASASKRKREALTIFKRFVRFLRDTERMDYDSAEYVLDVFAGRDT